MEVSYVYVKTRADFGKQCIFDDYGPNVDEDISPNPELFNDYILRDPSHVATQKSTQMALHEAQTVGRKMKDSGMCHVEGGWPKEINPKDEEAIMRFRKRVQREEDWAPRMHNLLKPMEHCIYQNNTNNIYQHFFDDMIPTELVQPLGLRTVNVYPDPQRPTRPVNKISWSPDRGNKIVVSYCLMEFRKALSLSPYIYIWLIENPNEPDTMLKAFCPTVVTEFNPRDPSVLASGLMSGQVCSWDTREGIEPVQVSHVKYSHRSPANSLKWLHSKNNSEFFSAASDGQVMWWDMRKLRGPTETLVVDLNNLKDPMLENAIGVSCTNFEPTMGTKFLLGMENGLVVSGSRKAKTSAEKLALQFKCHLGPVIDVDRNGFNPKFFLTVGDWTARVWAEDTKEGNTVATKAFPNFLTGGCWSTSRFSTFYTIDRGGHLDVWDLLQGILEPIVNIQLCKNMLTAIAPHEDGALVAVGDYTGNVYLVEATEALCTFTKTDRANLSAYIDRCARYVKAIDARMREMKLVAKSAKENDSDDDLPVRGKDAAKAKDLAKGKEAAKGKEPARGREVGKGKEPAKGKDGGKGKEVQKAKEEAEKGKKKNRGQLAEEAEKIKRKTAVPDDLELVQAETEFFAIIEQETQKYAQLQDREISAKEPTVWSRKKSDRKLDKLRKSGKSPKEAQKAPSGPPMEEEIVIIKRSELRRPPEEPKPEEEEISLEGVEERRKSRVSKQDKSEQQVIRKMLEIPKRGRSKKGWLRTPCAGVCKPKICCRELRKIADKRSSRKEQDPGTGSDTSEATSATTSTTMVSNAELGARKKRGLPKKFPIDQKKLAVLKSVLPPCDSWSEHVTMARKATRGGRETSGATTWRTIPMKTEPKPAEDLESSQPEITEVETEYRDLEVSSKSSEDKLEEKKVASKIRRTKRISKPQDSKRRPFEHVSDIPRMGVIAGPIPDLPDDRRDDAAFRVYKEKIESARRRIYPRISAFPTIGAGETAHGSSTESVVKIEKKREVKER